MSRGKDSIEFFSLGFRIKKIRKQRNLSQAEFAKMLGIASPGYISAIERDEKVPGGDVLKTLKSAFGVSVDWLLTGEGSMFLDGPTAEVPPPPQAKPPPVDRVGVCPACQQAYGTKERLADKDDQIVMLKDQVALLKEAKQAVEEKKAMLEKENEKLAHRLGIMETQQRHAAG